MSAPQVGSALIDLSTYGELESYLYGNHIKPSNPHMKLDKVIGIIMVIIILYYLKKI